MDQAQFPSQSISFGIRAGDSHCVGIRIDPSHLAVAKFFRCDGQNTRARSQVQNRPVFAGKRDHSLQAKASRGMLAGAETQTRVEHEQRLVLFWVASAPAWLEQQARPNVNRSEMSLP